MVRVRRRVARARKYAGTLGGCLRRLRDRQALFAGEELLHQLPELRFQLRLGADLELPRALAREAEVLAQLLQRHRLVLHDAHFDDVTLAWIEPRQRLDDALLHDVALLLLRQFGVREVGPVGHEIDVRRAAVFTHRRVEREIAPLHALLHLDHFAGLHAQLARDGLLVGANLLGPVELLQLAARTRQAEEELPLRLRGPELHQAPALEDVVLDERADPPDRV